MDPVTGLSLGRIAVGVLSLADPVRASQVFQLDVEHNPQLPYLARLFGAREVALGVATLAARGSTRRNLVLLGILVDGADAATGYLGMQDGTVSRKAGTSLAAPALGAVLSGLLGLRRGRRAARAAVAA